jgi:tetratricopeptide (TPR) repeat protein
MTYLRPEEAGSGNDVQPYIKLGEIESLLGKHGNAIASLARALEIDPTQDDALYQTAQAYASLGNMDSAAHYYRAAHEQLPDEPTYIEGLGLALARQGDAKSAASVLEMALTLDTRSYLTYSTLGNLYALSLGNPRRAVEYYEKSLNLEPDIRDTRINLGNVYVLLGEYRSALKEYEAELQQWPDNPETLVNIGRVLMLEGRTREAKDAFRKALKISPGLEVARLSLERLEKP